MVFGSNLFSFRILTDKYVWLDGAFKLIPDGFLAVGGLV
jgi:hypothetical protein